MTGIEVLIEVLARGGRVIWSSPRPRLLLPPDLRPTVEADRDTIREILRRAAILREQAQRFICEGKALPLLALPDRLGDAGCLSCGASVSTGHYRCEVCAIAVALALEGMP